MTPVSAPSIVTRILEGFHIPEHVSDVRTVVMVGDEWMTFHAIEAAVDMTLPVYRIAQRRKG